MSKYARWIILLAIALSAGCGATVKKSQEASAHYSLGLSYLQQRNATQALKEFLLAEEANPAGVDIHSALGYTYQLKKAYPEAERHYLRALELSQNAPTHQNNLADLYLAMERWDDAIRLFREASSNLLFANPEVALTGMGYAYFQKGEYLDAVTACKKALEHRSRYPQAYLRLGEAYYALEKNDLAIKAFEEALSIAPDYAWAHYRLGLAYVKERQTDAAAASFREVTRIAPDSEAGRLAADYLEILQ